MQEKMDKRHRDYRKDFRLPALTFIAVVVAIYSVWPETFKKPPIQGELTLSWNGRQVALSLPGRENSRQKGMPAEIRALWSGYVAVNQASAELLETLPGIGPELAQRIVAERSLHGLYRSAGDLRRVPGIGVKRANQLERYLRFD